MACFIVENPLSDRGAAGGRKFIGTHELMKNPGEF
jgi:hypothetical protein